MTTMYDVGTVTVAHGGTTVSGTNTFWKGKVFEGDLFTDPAQGLFARVTADATSNTSLSIKPWPGTNLSAAAYEVLFQADSIRSSERTRQLLEEMSVVTANGRGLFYTFTTATADADPGPGLLRLNNPTLASVTAAFLDNLDADGATVSAELDTWDDSTSTIRGKLWIRSIEDPSNFYAYSVTGSVVDGTGYRKLTLTSVGGSGSFAEGDAVMVALTRTGDIGLAGGQPAPQGRLSLDSALPVMRVDYLAATAVNYVPYVGNSLPIWNGSDFVVQHFTTLTMNLCANPAFLQYHPAGFNFDVFGFLDGATLRLGTGPAWTVGAVTGSDTTRATGAGSTELERLAGLPVNKNAISMRFGALTGDIVSIAARAGTYLGTIRITVTGQVSFQVGSASAGGGEAIISVWNAYNRVPIAPRVTDSTGTHTYNSATVRPFNNSNGNRISMVRGLNEDWVGATFGGLAAVPTASGYARFMLGLDSVTAGYSGAQSFQQVNVANALLLHRVGLSALPGLGWHYIQCLENSDAIAAVTFYAGASYMDFRANMRF